MAVSHISFYKDRLSFKHDCFVDEDNISQQVPSHGIN